MLLVVLAALISLVVLAMAWLSLFLGRNSEKQSARRQTLRRQRLGRQGLGRQGFRELTTRLRRVRLPVLLGSVSVLALSGCGSQYAGANVGQQVESWAKTSPDPQFASALSTLQGDLRRVTEVQSASDAALRTDCDVLVTDALSANQNLPTPDDQLTSVLTQAYSAAAQAGRDCLCAAGGGSCPAHIKGKAALLEKSGAERSEAQRGFIKAQARFDLLATFAGGSG